MTDKEKLIKIKKLADAMYYGAFNMTTDASLLKKAMKEYRQFTIHEYCKEEPVSKVLDTESMIESHKQKLISQVNGMKDSPFVNMCLDSYKQGISEILDTLNLSNAQTIDATIGYWNHSGLSIDVKLPKDLKEGSKCKLIIIKEK